MWANKRITICLFVFLGLFTSFQLTGVSAFWGAISMPSYTVDLWPEETAPQPALCHLPSLPLLSQIFSCLEQWREPVWWQAKVSPGSFNPFRVIWHDFMEVSLGENSNVKHNLVLETWKKKPSDFFSSTFPLHTLPSFPLPLSGVIIPSLGGWAGGEATITGHNFIFRGDINVLYPFKKFIFIVATFNLPPSALGTASFTFPGISADRFSERWRGRML